MFVGQFEHSLDAKGRLVLPARFRQHLADGGYVSTLEVALGLWTPQQFEEMVMKLEQSAEEGRVPQARIRAFAAATDEIRPDSAGRILLPPRLRESIGLEKDAVIIGRLRRIEIFTPQGWAEENERGGELSETFDLLGI